MLGLFRRAVVIIYWIALPVAVMVCLGWLLSVGVGGSGRAPWTIGVGAGVFAVLIAWRLWLNSRALARTGPLPSARRLLLVVLPFALLALAGAALLGLGLVWISMGVRLLFGPELATSGYRDLVSGAALPIGGGILMAAVGGAMIIPLGWSLKTRPQPADNF